MFAKVIGEYVQQVQSRNPELFQKLFSEYMDDMEKSVKRLGDEQYGVSISLNPDTQRILFHDEITKDYKDDIRDKVRELVKEKTRKFVARLAIEEIIQGGNNETDG